MTTERENEAAERLRAMVERTSDFSWAVDFAAHLDSALATEREAAGSLDVERLIEAMKRARPFVDFGSPEQYGPRVATEYARLAPARNDAGEPEHVTDEDDRVLLQALEAGPLYAGPESPWWDALHRLAREGKCRGNGWRWTR